MFPNHARFPRRTVAVLGVVAGVALTDMGGARAQSGTVGTDQRYCDNSALGQVLSTANGNLTASAARGAAPGLIGNQFGKSRGQGARSVRPAGRGAVGSRSHAW